MKTDAKSRFVRTFSNLPIAERSMPIFIHPSYGPMAWRILYIEIMADTELGRDALVWLDELNLIEVSAEKLMDTIYGPTARKSGI